MAPGPAGERGHVVRGVDVEPGGEEGVRDPRGPALQANLGQDRACPPIHAPEQGRGGRRESNQVEPPVVAGAENGPGGGSKFPEGGAYERCGKNRAVRADEDYPGEPPGEGGFECVRHALAEVLSGLGERLVGGKRIPPEELSASGRREEEVAMDPFQPAQFRCRVLEKARIERGRFRFREGGAKPRLDLPRDGGLRQQDQRLRSRHGGSLPAATPRMAFIVTTVCQKTDAKGTIAALPLHRMRGAP